MSRTNMNEEETARVSTSIAKAILSDLADQAEHLNKTVILTRYNKDIAAIVPMQDLKSISERKEQKK